MSGTDNDELLVSAMKKLRLSESTPKRVSFTSKTPKVVTFTNDTPDTDEEKDAPEKEILVETTPTKSTFLPKTSAFVSKALLLLQKANAKPIENVQKRSPSLLKRSPRILSPFRLTSSSSAATDKIDHSHIKPVLQIKEMFSKKPATPKYTATRRSLTKLPSNANLRSMWQKKSMKTKENSAGITRAGLLKNSKKINSNISKEEKENKVPQIKISTAS